MSLCVLLHLDTTLKLRFRMMCKNRTGVDNVAALFFTVNAGPLNFVSALSFSTVTALHPEKGSDACLCEYLGQIHILRP